MITDLAGVLWGTGKDIRQHTGKPITDAMLQNWVVRKGLLKDRGFDQDGRPCVRYPVIQAAQLWATRGRRSVAA